MLKIINISGSTIGLIKVCDGEITQDNLEDKDYRVVSELTSQMLRLADPSLRLLKIIRKEASL